MKLRSDGSLEQYKAMLVACGNSEAKGSNFDEIYAHVAKMSAVRLFLQIYASRSWKVQI